MADVLRSDVMLAFAVMTAVTVAVRLGGFWLMSYVPVTPRVRRMMDALPGSIIVAAALPVGAGLILHTLGGHALQRGRDGRLGTIGTWLFVRAERNR